MFKLTLQSQLTHTDGSMVPPREAEPGVPYRESSVTLSEGLGFSRESLVVRVSGIAHPDDGRYEYICTATNQNDDATTSILVIIDVPGLAISCWKL